MQCGAMYAHTRARPNRIGSAFPHPSKNNPQYIYNPQTFPCRPPQPPVHVPLPPCHTFTHSPTLKAQSLMMTSGTVQALNSGSRSSGGSSSGGPARRRKGL